MSSNEGGQREVNQPRVPTKISEPSGRKFVSDTPVSANTWSPPLAPPVSPQAAVEAAKIASEQAARAEQERIAQRKALGERQLETVRAYASEVAALASTAAAIKPGPLAPLHIREAARAILHGGFIPPWTTANHDPMVLELSMLKERGRSYINGGLDALTAAGRVELDIAENAAHKALIARAKIVAGEA